MLLSGARCVEIDAWDDKDEEDGVKATHGFTLVSHISFRSICRVMREALEHEEKEIGQKPLPVMLSLENHCGEEGQKSMVRVMHEEWGDRLVTGLIDGVEDIKLEQLTGKIVVMVEYYLGQATGDDAYAEEAQKQEEEGAEEKELREKKNKAKQGMKIVPDLQALGCYSASVKPTSDDWLKGTMKEPLNHLINLGEGAVTKIIDSSTSSSSVPTSGKKELIEHNAQHLMRVYPAGTRITSHNLSPVGFWNVGAQVCALNWQTFDASMQINDALFAGTGGWALKPDRLRRRAVANGEAGKTGGRESRLKIHIVGATDLPLPQGHEVDEIRPYVTCSLYHPDFSHGAQAIKRKTPHYKKHGALHKLNLLGHHQEEEPEAIHPVWNEVLEWDPYPENELVFVRLLVKSDDRFKRNPVFAVASLRLETAVKDEFVFLRLLDLTGQETQSTLLVKISVETK